MRFTERSRSDDTTSCSRRPGRDQCGGRSADRAAGGRACRCRSADHRVVPPAADPVSLQTAVGFSAQGAEHVAVAAQGVEELGRAGVGVGESGQAMPPVMRPRHRRIWSPAPEHDRTDLDGFAAGGAFGAVERRTGPGFTVGGGRGMVVVGR
ncbi:PE family protein [Mycobacterium xenopi 4042]|uniref:PE family protein n=1 Tax=Mycobacterium xenopi 4042 TaxID=1299334 RepID=X7Z9Q0_MYCXE|nr:PE family protein [Mycobacterium xenopi 4042]